MTGPPWRFHSWEQLMGVGLMKVTKTRDQHRENAWRLRWTAGSKRHSIFWQGTEEQVEKARKHVRHLLECQDSEEPRDKTTSMWLSRLSDQEHRKLSGRGLVEPRATNQAVSLESLYKAFLKAQQSAEPSTVATYRRAYNSLTRRFGKDRNIRSITSSDAREFRDWLLTNGNVRDKKQKRKELGENTVRRRIGIARQMFTFGMDSGLIDQNPFRAKSLPTRVHRNPERCCYVTHDEFGTVIDACPDASWRAIVALNRLIGLRVPSEIVALRWEDVDLASGDLHIRAKKTKHHASKGLRTAPILPNLRPYLEDLWQVAQPGVQCAITDPVFPRY
jgi:integrase